MLCPYRKARTIVIFERNGRKHIDNTEFYPDCDKRCPFYDSREFDNGRFIEWCRKVNKEKL